MRSRFSDQVERARICDGGRLDSLPGDPFGAFGIMGPCGAELLIIASDGADVPEAEGWQHVSVSSRRRPPNWQEMCWVKDLFFDPEETVIQLHPPRSVYKDLHPFCLHMWKPPYALALPPHLLV